LKENKALSVLAGLIIGTFLGYWIYWLPCYFLKCGSIPVDGLFVPTDIWLDCVTSDLQYGVIPGAIIGLIGGFAIPVHLSRGHLAKSIGAFAWIPITIVAWITQWNNIYYMSSGRIVLTLLATFMSLMFILPISDMVSFIEKIRE